VREGNDSGSGGGNSDRAKQKPKQATTKAMKEKQKSLFIIRETK